MTQLSDTRSFAIRGSRAEHKARKLASGMGIGVLATVMTLSGCLRPYSKSVIDPEHSAFPGITDHLMQASSSDVRVIFVYGMCTHDEDHWITQGWDRIISSLFFSPAPTRSQPRLVGQVKIVDREYSIGAHSISGRFLLWSTLTAADKAKLNFDNPPSFSDAPGQFIWTRAGFNSTLKSGLLNDCSSDAVIYAGYRHDELQAALESALCAALDGAPSNNDCKFPTAYAHDGLRIVIVTESLGSRMVFDALTNPKSKAQRKGEPSVTAFNRHIAPEALNSSPHESTSSLTSALKVLSSARSNLLSTPIAADGQPVFGGDIHIVAFTDPNDLLSYRIPADASELLVPGVSVVNVITSNSDTYFGKIENPLPAHADYDKNPDVLRLLFDGTTPRPRHTRIGNQSDRALSPNGG
jgi:hypothetical protein